LDQILDLLLEFSMTIIDIHLTLSEELLASLEKEARERRLPRAHLLREAVAEYLARAEAARVRREMETYAEELAPNSGEFIADTDAHVVQRLLEETEW
jgi:hypothetical protein